MRGPPDTMRIVKIDTRTGKWDTLEKKQKQASKLNMMSLKGQCKKKMNTNELRMGKLVGKSRKGIMYHYLHPNCRIQNLKRCRIMSRKIETADSIFGIDNLLGSEYALISSLVEDLLVYKASKKSMQLATSHKVWTVKQPAVKKQCQSQLKRAKNKRMKVLYCNADTFTQEKKHELQVLMAEDQPDIVATTEVNQKGRSYKIEDIKIRGLYYLLI